MSLKQHIWASTLFAVVAGPGLWLAYQTTSEVDAKSFPHANAEANYFPRKGWTVGFHAFRMNGYKDLPVKVYAVTSAGRKGIQTVRVSSQSDKIVIGVRIKWFVVVNGGDAILAKDETPLIDLPGLVGALPKFAVKIPDASLATILTPVMKKRPLRGDFDVHVVVSEVKYLDGSLWNWPEPSKVIVAPLKKHHAAMDLCAGQTCRLAADLFSYQCAYSQGEQCENYGDECDSSICDLYMQ
jgi:hypothetical protein